MHVEEVSNATKIDVFIVIHYHAVKVNQQHTK